MCSRHFFVVLISLSTLAAMAFAMLILALGVSEYESQLQARVSTTGRASHPWMCAQCFEIPSNGGNNLCEGCSKGRHAQAIDMRVQSLSLASERATRWVPLQHRQDADMLVHRVLESVANHYAVFMQLTLMLFWGNFATWLLMRVLAPSHRRWLDARKKRKRDRLIEQRSAGAKLFADSVAEEQQALAPPPRPEVNHYAQGAAPASVGLAHRRVSSQFHKQIEI
jgi:hypothetical protein